MYINYVNSALKKTIAIVPIRSGSKGLPSKNTLNFCGLPLFHRAVNQALIFAERCIITTDIKDILEKKIPIPSKAEIHKRPNSLAQDDTRMDEVILDVISNKNIDLENTDILLLQATSPLRSDDDIKASLELFDSKKYEIVFTVCKSETIIFKHGFLKNTDFEPISRLEFLFQNRQDLDQAFKPNGAVYIFNSKNFVENKGFNFKKAGAVEMPITRSIDIDNLDDFKKAESLFLKKIDE